MTQFRRLLETGEDELACSLLSAAQGEAPPQSSLLRAGAAIGIPAALLAAPVSATVSGVVLSGIKPGGLGLGTGAAASGAALSTAGASSTAGSVTSSGGLAAGASVSALGGWLPSTLVPLTLGAILKPFMIGLLGGAFTLGGVKYALHATGPARPSQVTASTSFGNTARADSRQLSARSGSTDVGATATPASEELGEAGLSESERLRNAQRISAAVGEEHSSELQAGDDPVSFGRGHGAQGKAKSPSANARASLSAADSRKDSARALQEQGSQEQPRAAVEGSSGSDEGTKLSAEAAPSASAVASAAPPKVGASSLAAEIALIDQARTALLSRKPERVLQLVAQYRGTNFAPEAEKLKAQAIELLKQRNLANGTLSP